MLRINQVEEITPKFYKTRVLQFENGITVELLKLPATSDTFMGLPGYLENIEYSIKNSYIEK